MLCYGRSGLSGEDKVAGNLPISSVTDLRDVSFLATTRTLNPFFASWIEYSRPMPSEAPVMTNPAGQYHEAQ